MSHAFEQFNLEEPLLRSIQEKGYTTPSPIQLKAIPHLLDGKDIIACAQTGTGKSAAFSIPLLHSIYKRKRERGHRGIEALILAPTRELANQINQSLATYGEHTEINHTAIFGGIPRVVQIDHLSHEIDILVATPGRLLDLAEKGYLDFSNLAHFVLDEADQMLNLGFIDDVKKVIELLPTRRQTALFSATISPEIALLGASILYNPIQIETAAEQVTTKNVTQSIYYVQEELKANLLVHLLKKQEVTSAFIFTKTRKEADELSLWLSEQNFPTESIHSQKSQHERDQAIIRFKNREATLLIATDVAARGIDIENVSHVFNLGVPQESESYVHRIGRTGRASQSGKAITLCSPHEISKVKEIEKLIHHKIDVVKEHLYANATLIKSLAKVEGELKRKRGNNRRKRG
ncbi:MAG: DEAD/DEAH box helicase [Phocaeicola sp.]